MSMTIMDGHPNGDLSPETETRVNANLSSKAMGFAFQALTQAQLIMEKENERFGFESDTYVYDEGTPYDRFVDQDLDVLETADSIWHNSSLPERARDDLDLRNFEIDFEVWERHSPRIKALALRTLANDLARMAMSSLDDLIELALADIKSDEDGSINIISTFVRYHLRFPL